MQTIGRNISNPAAFGWQWVEPDSSTEFQLVYPRDTGTLYLGMRRKAASAWDTVTVTNPQRFLMGGHPTTVKAWRVVVDRWFAAAEEAT